MKIDWKLVKNFEKKEWIRNPDNILPELVYMVDELASYIKSCYTSTFCIIHVAWDDTGHEQDSRHYEGRAVDLHFAGLPLFFQFNLAQQFAFTGIGVYPFWRNPGLHLEIENMKPLRAKRWWRDANGEYRAITEYAFYEAMKIV